MPASLEIFRQYTREQITRAIGVRKLHVALCHPNDEILGRMLDVGGIVGCPYTSSDVRVAADILGKCLACVKGKYREAPAFTSMSPPAGNIGDNVYCDIIPFDETTIGGNNHALLTIDEKSDFPHGVGLKTKTAKRIAQAVIEVHNFYRRYRHDIKQISPDAEPNFIKAAEALGGQGIEVM
jgi:hypothetical protein